MLGAICGDYIGSIYEHQNTKSEDFPLFSTYCKFTDDSVLTAATAEALMGACNYSDLYKKFYDHYPNAGYGAKFRAWAESVVQTPYNSFGNGSGMRVSPVGFAFDSLEKTLNEAKHSAEVTHNHSEGIKGAQAIAAAIFMARNGESKDKIRAFTSANFGYDMDRTIASIRPTYTHNLSCQGSVPEAIIAFLDSNDFESAIRKAISLGGDSDTIACMAGSIAEPFYGGVPNHIRDKVVAGLDNRLRDVLARFHQWVG